MLEVLRQDPIAELLWLFNDESVSFPRPGDNLLRHGIVHDLKELHEERRNVVYRLVLIIELQVCCIRRLAHVHVGLGRAFAR